MARHDPDDQLLGYIAAGAALLFAVTVSFVVIAQALGPVFGFHVGAPSDLTLGTMIGAVVTLSGSVGLRALRRILNGKDSDGRHDG